MKVPVSIAASLDRDLRLQHQTTRAYPSGYVQSTYSFTGKNPP